LAQPFLSYVIPDLVTCSAGADINYEWINDQATIPVNLGISKLIKGKQQLSIGGGVRYYVEKPAGGPDWGCGSRSRCFYRSSGDVRRSGANVRSGSRPPRSCSPA